MERKWKDIPLAERREVNAVLESFGLKATTWPGKSYRDCYAARLEDLFDDYSETTPATLRRYITEDIAKRGCREAADRQLEEQRLAAMKAKREQDKRDKNAALERTLRTGEPLPARFRQPSGRCCECKKLLRDPESVRLGIGPDCLRRIANSGVA